MQILFIKEKNGNIEIQMQNYTLKADFGMIFHL